jgi:hypothetical protein
MLFVATTTAAHCIPKHVRAFVGLCDNKTQGIAKVGARIGDGDNANENLYWGCTEGLKSYFQASRKWQLVEHETNTGDLRILERLVFRHANGDAVLVAEAWRGANLRECYEAFQQAAVSGSDDFVAFIGHNVLMDTPIALPTSPAPRPTPVAVLCCKSERYFRARLEGGGVKPVLLTTQNMYPGSFLLHDALECWLTGGGVEAIRRASGAAYSSNQHISQSAALGVFADLSKPNSHPPPPGTIPPEKAPGAWSMLLPWLEAVLSGGAVGVAIIFGFVWSRSNRRKNQPNKSCEATGDNVPN